VTSPRIAIGPISSESVTRAVRDGGGTVVGPDDQADALVWLVPSDTEGLRRKLAADAAVRWIQLPFAGVEDLAAAGVFDPAWTWTCAKGAYAEPVAEHALMLALAGLRGLPERIAARSWGKPAGISLYDEPVTILGGGGIATRLLELTQPFRVRATVVRRGPEPLAGAERTLPASRLHEALADARIVFVALALTPETTGIIGAGELAVMRPDSWLVNVARGRHVDTDALVAALDGGAIAGAALDVTEPEPLPDGHPLWGRPNCIITPHTADTQEMIEAMLAARIRDNVARFAAGEPLEGRIDPAAGY
jgi:phosphoglycerate dehydrogenase-like enzyme